MAEPLTYRTNGIVLRLTKLGETDLIVTLLSELPHQVRAVAKGARKPGAKLAGVVGLGNEVDLLLRRGRSLDIISEGQLLTSRAGAAAEFEREAMMEAVLDVAAEMTVEGDHDPRLLPLTATALDAVLACDTALLPLTVAAYALKAASVQGYRPVLDSCVICGRPVGKGSNGGGEMASVSFANGGVLCDDCARSLMGLRVPVDALAWSSSLIRMRFSEILELSQRRTNDDSSESNAHADGSGHGGSDGRYLVDVGMKALAFACTWLEHYPGIRPRALKFVLSLDFAAAAADQYACRGADRVPDRGSEKGADQSAERDASREADR